MVRTHRLWPRAILVAIWLVTGHRSKLVISQIRPLSAWALATKRALWPMPQRTLARAEPLHAINEAEHNDPEWFAPPIHSRSVDTPISESPGHGRTAADSRGARTRPVGGSPKWRDQRGAARRDYCGRRRAEGERASVAQLDDEGIERNSLRCGLVGATSGSLGVSRHQAASVWR